MTRAIQDSNLYIGELIMQDRIIWVFCVSRIKSPIICVGFTWLIIISQRSNYPSMKDIMLISKRHQLCWFKTLFLIQVLRRWKNIGKGGLATESKTEIWLAWTIFSIAKVRKRRTSLSAQCTYTLGQQHHLDRFNKTTGLHAAEIHAATRFFSGCSPAAPSHRVITCGHGLIP